MSLCKFFVTFCFNFGRLKRFSNLTISHRLSNLFSKTCLKDALDFVAICCSSSILSLILLISFPPFYGFNLIKDLSIFLAFQTQTIFFVAFRLFYGFYFIDFSPDLYYYFFHLFVWICCVAISLKSRSILLCHLF